VKTPRPRVAWELLDRSDLSERSAASGCCCASERSGAPSGETLAGKVAEQTRLQAAEYGRRVVQRALRKDAPDRPAKLGLVEGKPGNDPDRRWIKKPNLPVLSGARMMAKFNCCGIAPMASTENHRDTEVALRAAFVDEGGAERLLRRGRPRHRPALLFGSLELCLDGNTPPQVRITG